MQISHAMTELEQQVASHLRFADPDQTEMIGELIGVLTPAIRQSMLGLVEAAATEVNAQLIGQRVEVRLVDGDPELVVTQTTIPTPPLPPNAPDPFADDEARITVRLPGYLKDLISDAASDSGDSVNGWVIDALKTRSATAKVGNKVNRTIQL
jgi:hypothetical protein